MVLTTADTSTHPCFRQTDGPPPQLRVQQKRKRGELRGSQDFWRITIVSVRPAKQPHSFLHLVESWHFSRMGSNAFSLPPNTSEFLRWPHAQSLSTWPCGFSPTPLQLRAPGASRSSGHPSLQPAPADLPEMLWLKEWMLWQFLWQSSILCGMTVLNEILINQMFLKEKKNAPIGPSWDSELTSLWFCSCFYSGDEGKIWLLWGRPQTILVRKKAIRNPSSSNI